MMGPSAQFPFDPHPVKALSARLMLFKVENVSVIPVDKLRDCRVQTLSVGALHEQYSAVFSWPVSKLRFILFGFCRENGSIAIFSATREN